MSTSTGSRGWWLLVLGAALCFSACEIRFGYDDETSCGSCVLENADSKCSESKCIIEFCHPDYGNCDGRDANGCETDLRNSWQSCGLCRNACTNGVGCVNGACDRSTEIARTVLTTGGVTLAVDETHVYFGHALESSGIFRARKSSGATEPIAIASRVVSLVVDETYAYWLELPGFATSSLSLVRRAQKDPAVAAPTTLASVGGYQSAIVLQGEFLYLSMPADSGQRLARVHRSGTTAEIVPGWDRRGTLFGLQARGQHVVFAFSGAESSRPMVVDYAPETGSFSIIEEDLRGFLFTVDDDALYYEDTYAPSNDPTKAVISRRILADGSIQSVAIDRVEYRSMQVDRGSLFLLDNHRGNLLEIDVASFTPRVLFGAQRNLMNIALDEGFVYFADGNRILRMAR